MAVRRRRTSLLVLFGVVVLILYVYKNYALPNTVYMETKVKVTEKEQENSAQKQKEEQKEEEENFEDKDRHVSRLLIIAYMRTGSSMTGRLMNYNPQIFYWYEPLHSLERYYVTGGKPELPYRNKTRNELFKASEMAGGNSSATLACDVDHVYNGILTDWFMTYGQHGTKPFFECFKGAMNNTDAWKQCSLNMTRTCRTRYSATAVKVIRLHMARAVEIMTRDPKVKVLHLIRDPRAVLLSRHLLGFANFKQLNEEASLLCGKYLEDLQAAPKMGSPLRKRYMMVRYEDIVNIPIEFTERLYAFMGLPVTDSVLNQVKAESSKAKKVKKCPDCPPTPLNSTEVAQAWRSVLSFKDVQIISKECQLALKELRYRETFSSELELKDLGVSSVYDLVR